MREVVRVNNVELARFVCTVAHTLACMVAYYVGGKADKVKACEDAYQESMAVLDKMVRGEDEEVTE